MQQDRTSLVTEAFRLIVLAALPLAVAGCTAASAEPKAGAPAAASTGPLEVVMVGKAVRKTMTLTTTQPARMEALEQTPIHSKVAAYVGEVLVDFGDKVKKDQPLLKLLAPELDAALAQRRALLAKANAQLAQSQAAAKAADSAVTTAQARIAQAEAGTDRAQSDIARSRSEYSRIAQLAAAAATTQQLADEAQQRLAAAEASLKEAVAGIQAAKAGAAQAAAEAAKAASDVAASEAEIRVAAANVAQAEAEHSYLTILSPFAGVVTSRRVDPGHFVQPAGASSSPLFVVARTDRMRIFVAVPEGEAGYVDLEDPVTIDVQSLRGAELLGKVSRTGFALDADSRSLTTIIDLDNAENRLRPGLYATAKITLQEKKNALALPAAAVVRQGKEALCYRLISGKATKTPIQLGIKVADEFEITSGISGEDRVILNKAASLKDGQPVEELKPAAK